MRSKIYVVIFICKDIGKMVVAPNNFDAPVDGILLEIPGTKLIVNKQEVGTATLYITQE